MANIKEYTLDQKRTILCSISAEAEQDDGDWFSAMWNGISAYKDAPEVEIEEEWQEMLQDNDADDMTTQEVEDWLDGYLKD